MTPPSLATMESTSSTQSSTSRITSSTSSTKPHFARQTSDTHVFPAYPPNPIPTTSEPRGLSESTKALARQVFHPKPLRPALSDDHTVLFSNGLQWLLDTATETEKAAEARNRRQARRGVPLTEDAVRSLDDHGRNMRVRELGDMESVSAASVDRARIDAWVTEMDTAP